MAIKTKIKGFVLQEREKNSFLWQFISYLLSCTSSKRRSNRNYPRASCKRTPKESARRNLGILQGYRLGDGVEPIRNL